MKRIFVAAAVLLVSVGVLAQQGGGPTQDIKALIAKMAELEKATPQLQVVEEVLPLIVPGQTIGETTGVAKNSKGNLFVYTRTGNAGPARGATAAKLFEFDPNLKFVKEWGPNMYAASFAHTVRVDKSDNVWVSDEGSNMVVKFNPQGNVDMVLGRKPEAVDYLEDFLEQGNIEKETPPARNGVFNRPTDVTWDHQDNIFVADGYNNARVAKISKEGRWLKSYGTKGAGPGQFNTVHAITADAKGNIYVGDRSNRRIHVLDSDLNPIRMITTAGQPWTMCVSPGPTQYLFSGDGAGKLYKSTLDGTLVGWAQLKTYGQLGCIIHELHCESETVLYKGDCSLWKVEKITIKGGGRQSAAR